MIQMTNIIWNVNTQLFWSAVWPHSQCPLFQTMELKKNFSSWCNFPPEMLSLAWASCSNRTNEQQFISLDTWDLVWVCIHGVQFIVPDQGWGHYKWGTVVLKGSSKQKSSETLQRDAEKHTLEWMNRRHGMERRWSGKMGKAFMLCAQTVHRMGSNADVHIQADTAWLDKVAQTNSDIHVYIHSIHSFTLTNKNNPTCARKSCGASSWDQMMKHCKRQDLWRDRKGRSGLRFFPGVFESFRFEDDISAVGGVLLRQKRDKKGPEESGGPVWETHEKRNSNRITKRMKCTQNN